LTAPLPAPLSQPLVQREKGWGKVKSYSDGAQRVDDLFYEYARILDGVQPKVFIAENVSGLVKGTAKGYFKRILQALRDCGYNVSCRVLDARWLGVPQMRKRTIFIGVRNDLGIEPVHPKPLPYSYTIGDALVIPPDDTTAKILGPDTETYKFWVHTKAGDTLGNTCKRLTGRNSFLTHCKQSPHVAANTVTQGIQQLYHWTEPRTLTLGELRRISSFPDDFILTGTFAQQWERIGRAVPPVMMSKIAATVANEILSKIS
jgi:DNA (cytosine-5)-methyltransferase 1